MPPASESHFSEPAAPAECSADGVDLTLIRAFLALTPAAERLLAVEDRQADMERIRAHVEERRRGR